jgi:hypothetical protein
MAYVHRRIPYQERRTNTNDPNAASVSTLLLTSDVLITKTT